MNGFSWHYLSPIRVRKLLPIHLGSGYFLCVLTHAPTSKSGISHPVSIDYALRPRLRSRLTQSGRTWLWKPWGFGVLDSHQYLRYSSRHSHFRFVHSCLPLLLLPTTERSPTDIFISHSFGTSLSPVHFRRRSA